MTGSEFPMENSDKLDASRIRRLTTWKPEKLKLENVTQQSSEEVLPDKIDLLFEGLIWAGVLRHQVFIGIYNSKPELGPI